MSRLSIFSTNGSGLCDWEEVGTLNRETAIYKKLHESGWEVSFFTYDKKPDLPDIGFSGKVVCQRPFVCSKKLDFLYQLFMPLLRFRQGRKSDVIITNQAHGGWPAIIAGYLWNAKVVARCGMVHGECSEVLNKTSNRARKKTAREKWTFKHADKCIVPTKELALWIENNYQISHNKIEVVPNFVDVSQFKPANKSVKDYDIVCVGRLVPKKRFELLLEALKGSNLKVLIIGNGKFQDKLSKMARKYSINLSTIPRIEHDDLPAYLSNAKIYVNVSEWEGHPKALIEAMACGCACLGAKAPGIKNLLLDNQTGVLVEPDAEQIRNKIERLLADENLRERLGGSARDYAIKHFSLDTVFLKYKQLFDEVLKQ